MIAIIQQIHSDCYYPLSPTMIIISMCYYMPLFLPIIVVYYPLKIIYHISGCFQQWGIPKTKMDDLGVPPWLRTPPYPNGKPTSLLAEVPRSSRSAPPAAPRVAPWRAAALLWASWRRLSGCPGGDGWGHLRFLLSTELWEFLQMWRSFGHFWSHWGARWMSQSMKFGTESGSH